MSVSQPGNCSSPAKANESASIASAEGSTYLRYFNLSTDGAGGSVSLHRLVLVFKGGDCLLAEEA